MINAPLQQDLVIYRGATFSAWFRWSVGDDRESAAPVDLTGCTARMQARHSVLSPVVLLELSTENGGIVLGREPGVIELVFDAANTAKLPWATGVWDLEITFSNGDVRRLFEGGIAFMPEVTRDD